MIYESSMQIEGKNHSLASLAGLSVGTEQEAALKSYLGRSKEVRDLFIKTVQSGKSVTFVPGDGLFVRSITYGVGGTKQYNKIADWVPEKSAGPATSFEAKRVPNEAVSFEASAPAWVQTAEKTVFISGSVSDSIVERMEDALLNIAISRNDPFKPLRDFLRDMPKEKPLREIAEGYKEKEPHDNMGNTFLAEMQKEGSQFLFNMKDKTLGWVLRELNMEQVEVED